MSDPTALADVLPPQWRTVMSQALAETAERRARVLKHPDLAELLKAKPLGYARPDQWNGYVPPLLMPEELCGRGCGRTCRLDHLAKRNDSPRRAALVDIAAEAMRREVAA